MLTENQLQDIFEIAEILSNSDRDLFAQLKEAVFATDPNHILNMFESYLSAEGFDQFLDQVTESEKDNLWLILVTLLTKQDYIFPCDIEVDLTDFINGFDQLKQVRAAGVLLKLDPDGLNPGANLAQWLVTINTKFEAEGLAAGLLSITEDKFYVFFNQIEKVARLQQLAQGLDIVIA
ncbi:TPA: DUF6630 family protein [Streptococcus suis]